MAFVNWQARGTRAWAPANINANEANTNIIQIGAGDVVQAAFCRINVGFDGTTAVILVGDLGDTDGFLDAGDITEATAGLYGPGDGALICDGLILYTAANHVVACYNTDGTSTAASTADIWIWVAKADPH